MRNSGDGQLLFLRDKCEVVVGLVSLVEQGRSSEMGQVSSLCSCVSAVMFD